MEAVLAVFAGIDDPRDHTAQYELPALLFIALAATLCGARSCVDIADFAAANRADLADMVDLPAGATPSHDTFSRLFRLLDPGQLEAALRRFAVALREDLGLRPAEGTVAVDGKRLRRGYDCGRAHMPPLMVGIWDAETRLSLAARAGADGIEVAATLAALKTVSLKGCVVTGDALHCHPDMARQVRAQGGHYLLKLKANHGSLLAAAQSAFTAAEAQGTLQCSSTEDDANDRVEHRCGCVFPFPRRHPPSLAFWHSGGSTACEPSMAARPRVRPSTWPCRNACRLGACCRSRDGTGAWRTTATASSTWSSARTTPEPARTMRRAIYRSFDAWHWTSCVRTRCHAPSPVR
jgi:predicted transposase YbfD/YdcC